MQNYRQIKAWQRGHAIAIAIHRIARGFTRQGFATLRSQLSRAADSVPSNIVEGCGANSPLDFARYLDTSIKSANEVEWRLQMARDLDLIPPDTWSALTNEIVEIRKMTYGYRKQALGNMDPPPPPPPSRPRPPKPEPNDHDHDDDDDDEDDDDQKVE